MVKVVGFLSSAVLGVDAYMVEVEVDIALGLPSFSTVGLPDLAVKESRDRVKAAIKNCGFGFTIPCAASTPMARTRRAPSCSSGSWPLSVVLTLA